MTYAFPAWEFEAEYHLLKLQRLQNKALRTIGNFPKRTSVREMHKAFNITYVYDYITNSCRQQAEVIQNHENENVRYVGQGEARYRKYKRRNLAAVMCMIVQVTRLSLLCKLLLTRAKSAVPSLD
jgi:hypothetical protein